MTQYMPVEQLLAIPPRWERYVPPVPLGEIIPETRRRLEEALAKWDERPKSRNKRQAA